MYIVLAIAAIILAILFCPIYLKIEYYESIIIKTKVLFFWIKIFPRHEKEIGKLENKKNHDNKNLTAGENKKENKIKEMLNQRGLKGFLNILNEFGKIVLGTCKMLKSKVKIDNLNMLIDVADEDSAKTAVRYGQVCACVFPFMNIILKQFKIKDYSVRVNPNFMNDTSMVSFNLDVHIKLISIIEIALWALTQFIKSFYLKQEISKN